MMSLQLCFFMMICFNSLLAIDDHIEKGYINKNCSHFLSSSTQRTDWSRENKGRLKCPPWHERDEYRNCTAGNPLRFLVKIAPGTSQAWIQASYCMTTSHENDTDRTDVVGSCLYTFQSGISLQLPYYPLPCNISKLNDYTCADLNRKGQLCGRCVEGYAPPVFSYSLSCVNCTEYHLNWLKYIGVGFGPLTIFCLLICVFHINAMSQYLYGFVFYSQILTMPIVLRVILTSHGYHPSTSVKYGEAAYISLFSIWNFDMFRLFYAPFCLHPRMTVLQALALDYLIAIYPLALLLIIFVLISLHNRNFAIVVSAWKPINAILRPFIANLNIQASLVESFATLFFLSAMKVQSVTLDLLSPTPLYYVNGTTSNKLYLLLAGDVEYFGNKHLPYAILALSFLLLFTILPALLLFLYPYRFFQQFLNRTNCNFLSLWIFMNAFQGNYNRFFSGIFFLTRFIIVASIVLLSSIFSLVVTGTIITMLGFSVAILHPQRMRAHYILDCFVLMMLSLFFLNTIGFFSSVQSYITSTMSQVFSFITFVTPLVYITCLVLYWIIVKNRIPQRFGKFVVRKTRSLFHSESNEEQRLLVDQCTYETM